MWLGAKIICKAGASVRAASNKPYSAQNPSATLGLPAHQFCVSNALTAGFMAPSPLPLAPRNSRNLGPDFRCTGNAIHRCSNANTYL
jgi:hypothetical protein